MNISEIKQTMLEKGIPAEVMGQFIFPETEAGTPEKKIAFVNQMDNLLTKEQILSVMEEQGCERYLHDSAAGLMEKLSGKPIKERIEILNSTKMNEQPRSRLNADGTLSIYWWYEDETKKFICVCPIMSKIEKPATVSLTYCGCCSGHVKYHFQNFLGVKLRLLETVSSPINSNGEKYCEHCFEIIYNGEEQK